jgi:hypothetical protein
MQPFCRSIVARVSVVTLCGCAVAVVLSGTASAQGMFAPQTVLETPFKTDPGTANDGPFTYGIGSIVDVSGDTALVVAWEEFNQFYYQYAWAYLFQRDAVSNTWQLVRTLQGSRFDPTHFSRCCITAAAIGGSTAVVSSGYPYTYVFERNQGGPDAWGEVTTLAVPDNAYVLDVAVSGNTVAVSASKLRENYANVIYVFERNHGGAGAWGLVATLPGVAPRPPFEVVFSLTVALSGDTLLAGVIEGEGLQQVRVYERNRGGTNAWGFLKRLPYLPPTTPNAPPPVAIDGDTAVVGGKSGPYVFERHRGGTNAWGRVPTAAPLDDFYTSRVDISGNVIVTSGQVAFPTLGGRDTLRTYARNQNGANAWGAIASPPVPEPPPPYGPPMPWSLSPVISGDTVVVGAPMSAHWASVAGNGIGAALVFASDVDRDGERDDLDACPRDPLNNVIGGCRRPIGSTPVVDNLMTLLSMATASVNGDLVVTARFRNTSQLVIRNPFLAVAELSGGNMLKNADGGAGGVGATFSPDVGDGLLSPGESMTVRLVVGRASPSPFRFFVHVQGDF